LEVDSQDENLEQAPIVYAYMGDSRTGQIDDELNAKLEEAFHKQTSLVIVHDVAKIASEYDPIDLAYAVTRLPPYARVVLYENLPDLNAKIIFMINAGSSTRSAIFRQIDDQEIKRLIEGMPPDEAVWILDDMSDRRLKRVLDLLDPKRAKGIRELQKHDRHSAGRLMSNEFFAFELNTTIGEAAAQIRNNPGIDLTRTVFVLNSEGELIGSVPARNLIVNPDYLPIRQVMGPVLHKVTPDAHRDEVVDLVERYKIPALPVVNEHDRLLGVITYEDVVEALEDIASETIASFAGTAEDLSEHEPIIKRFFWRAPWLLVTLCGGLITSTAMAHFTDRLWFVFVPLFVPLITGMSGNVGIQCSTLLVRAMSTGELSPGTRGDAIFKELMIGSLIGVVFGALCGFVIFLLTLIGVHPFAETSQVALVAMVSCGVLGACLTATTLGSFSPFFFARFGVDPAVASGPIVTAFNDVLSTLMFFLVAKVVHAIV
jgi:magnesium transporter